MKNLHAATKTQHSKFFFLMSHIVLEGRFVPDQYNKRKLGKNKKILSPSKGRFASIPSFKIEGFLNSVSFICFADVLCMALTCITLMVFKGQGEPIQT